MKTLILYEAIEQTYFFSIDGDYRHLNNVYIGESNSKLEQELDKLIYKNGELRLTELKEPTKDWTFFIKCGEL